MRWAYLGVVRPALIWGHRARFHENRLRKLNRLTINTFASLPRSTLTRALEIMLDIIPLHLFCEQEALATKVRLNDILDLNWRETNKKKTHCVSHLRAWDNLLEEHDMDPEETDRCSKILWSSGYKINKTSFDGTSKHRTKSQYNIYTDGSRVSNRTGAGAVIYKNTRPLQEIWARLPYSSTVFQAEITAISLAANALCDRREDGMKFVKLFVDSQAALLALSNPMITSKTVYG